MKIYPKDSSAEAVILCDYGKNNLFNLTRHTRIKIIKKGGLSLANIQQLISTDGRLDIIKASTFNLVNGEIVETPLTNKGIFERDFNKSYKLATFTMPSVKEGSIIEYIYQTTSAPLEWRFQMEVPTRLSEYWANFPNIVKVRKYMQGYVPVSEYKEIGENTAHWILKDVPAFRKEPFMSSETDYISKVTFVIDYINSINAYSYFKADFMNTWEKMNEMLPNEENFGKLITGSGFLKDLVSQITDSIKDSPLKIKALTNYVKQNFEWDGQKEFWGSPLKKVVEKKKGSSGDLNILLASMLDKAGFEVDMILLSTRDHGFIRKPFPSMRQLNYAICSVIVGNKVLLLDATEKYLPYDVLPSYCLNDEGLIISKKRTGWINLVPTVKDKTIIETKLDLTSEGILDGKLSYIHEGYDGMKARKEFFSKEEGAYSKKILIGSNWTVKKKEFSDMEDNSKSAKSSYEIVVDEHATTDGNVIYLNPFITPTIENQFKASTRTYPVEFGTRIEKVCLSRIAIPDNYIVDELPKGVALVLPENSARFIYNISQQGNTINVTSSFLVNKSLFTQEEYPRLREFYSQVVAKQAEQIVLRRK